MSTDTTSTSTANTTTDTNLNITPTAESFMDRQLRLRRENHPAFKFGFLLGDRDRKNVQRLQHDGVYCDAIRRGLQDRTINCVSTVAKGSDINRIGHQILHSVLAYCWEEAECWKSIPSRYPFKDVAKAASGLPVDRELACRLAGHLVSSIAEITGNPDWEVTVYFERNLSPGCSVCVDLARTGLHTAEDFKVHREHEVRLAKLDLTAMSGASCWQIIPQLLYGAMAHGARPTNQVTGSMVSDRGHGHPIYIEVNDGLDQDSLGLWVGGDNN